MSPTSQSSRALLTQLLSLLRAVHWSHWTTHWQVRGHTAYGDHLLFERLYTGTTEEIDSLAEKVVSYFGADAVASSPSVEFVKSFLDTYESVSEPYKKALMIEHHLQNALRKVYQTIKDSDEMSLGLDDFLMATANAHETNIYLLQQNLRSVSKTL